MRESSREMRETPARCGRLGRSPTRHGTYFGISGHVGRWTSHVKTRLNCRGHSHRSVTGATSWQLDHLRLSNNPPVEIRQQNITRQRCKRLLKKFVCLNFEAAAHCESCLNCAGYKHITYLQTNGPKRQLIRCCMQQLPCWSVYDG